MLRLSLYRVLRPKGTARLTFVGIFGVQILMGLGGSPKRKTGEKKMKESVEIMREVPSGPDPLHHNAGPQHRPNITPYLKTRIIIRISGF